MKNLMSSVILIFSLSSIAASSCKQPIEQLPKEDDVLWKTVISNNLLEGEFPKFIYNNAIITLGSKNGKNAIIAIDRNSGKELWQWNDLFNDFPLYIQQVHIYQNTLVIRRVGSLYSINLNNGQTLWRETIQGRFMRDNVIGIGEQFFFAALHQNLYAASTSKGNPQLFANINLNNHPRNVLLNIQSVVNDRKDTLLIIPHLIDTIPLPNEIAFFSVVNKTKNRIEYTKQILPAQSLAGFGNEPIIINGRIYLVAHYSIFCFDLNTGNQIWEEKFPSIFAFSNIIYHNGMIIGNCEDTFMYALDAKTGKQLWATKTAGTSSRLFEMNGVIYFTGGGDGLLHAIDAKTGTHIWKKESPDLTRNPGAWFFDSVTGADGKIYVSSYLSLFCYKAAR